MGFSNSGLYWKEGINPVIAEINTVATIEAVNETLDMLGKPHRRPCFYNILFHSSHDSMVLVEYGVFDGPIYIGNRSSSLGDGAEELKRSIRRMSKVVTGTVTEHFFERYPIPNIGFSIEFRRAS
jgi:hypothetical protein